MPSPANLQVWALFDQYRDDVILQARLPDLLLATPPPLGLKNVGGRRQALALCLRLGLEPAAARDVGVEQSEAIRSHQKQSEAAARAEETEGGGGDVLAFKDVLDALIGYNFKLQGFELAAGAVDEGGRPRLISQAEQEERAERAERVGGGVPGGRGAVPGAAEEAKPLLTAAQSSSWTSMRELHASRAEARGDQRRASDFIAKQFAMSLIAGYVYDLRQAVLGERSMRRRSEASKRASKRAVSGKIGSAKAKQGEVLGESSAGQRRRGSVMSVLAGAADVPGPSAAESASLSTAALAAGALASSARADAGADAACVPTAERVADLAIVPAASFAADARPRECEEGAASAPPLPAATPPLAAGASPAAARATAAPARPSSTPKLREASGSSTPERAQACCGPHNELRGTLGSPLGLLAGCRSMSLSSRPTTRGEALIDRWAASGSPAKVCFAEAEAAPALAPVSPSATAAAMTTAPTMRPRLAPLMADAQTQASPPCEIATQTDPPDAQTQTDPPLPPPMAAPATPPPPEVELPFEPTAASPPTEGEVDKEIERLNERLSLLTEAMEAQQEEVARQREEVKRQREAVEAHGPQRASSARIVGAPYRVTGPGRELLAHPSQGLYRPPVPLPNRVSPRAAWRLPSPRQCPTSQSTSPPPTYHRQKSLAQGDGLGRRGAVVGAAATSVGAQTAAALAAVASPRYCKSPTSPTSPTTPPSTRKASPAARVLRPQHSGLKWQALDPPSSGEASGLAADGARNGTSETPEPRNEGLRMLL